MPNAQLGRSIWIMAKECTEWFGYTLRRLVESSGLSYRQLAARCGCTEGCISRIANGNVGMPSLSIAKGMADAFGMTLEQMWSTYVLDKRSAGYRKWYELKVASKRGGDLSSPPDNFPTWFPT